MKITMVGPVYPYKGGISHYTGLLHKALSKSHEVEMISYKMQYPRILFKKEQKDHSNDTFKVEHTEFLLHTANPFNWVKTALHIKKTVPDVVIVQWWHPYFAPCYYILSKLLRKTKLFFVCHNVFPHEHFPLDRFLSGLVLKQGNYFIVQSGTDEKDLLSMKPDARYTLSPHPTYNAFKINDLSHKEARDMLMIDESIPVILFFGFVREYKGLKHLLRAMRTIREELQDIQLWVVGDFGSDRQDYFDMINELAVKDCIRVIDGYVPDKEVEKYFAAADMVALPYESATQSGIVQIAYGFEKPVVVTDVGGLPDVVEDGTTGYVVPAGDSDKLAEAVIKYFREHKADEFVEHIRERADFFSWERMAERVDKLISN